MIFHATPSLRASLKRQWGFAFIIVLALAGCHAASDDPAGQADELSDPVRRENAIFNLTNLYTKALADHGGDRNHEAVKVIADSSVEKLSATYVDNPTDRRNGLAILELLKEMRDPRSLPALVKALDWRMEVSEEHATRAAQTIAQIEVPEDKKGDVIQALDSSLRRITDTRPKDVQMQVAMLRALGSMGDKRATPILIEIATKRDGKQGFEINRLAAQQLGKLRDPAAVESLVSMLFVFAPNDPGQRMNDVATEALVRMGTPALQPMLKVLAGTHEKANAMAAAYISAIARINAVIAAKMSTAQVTAREAAATLGALGSAQALEPLLAESRSGDSIRRMNAALALIRLDVSPAARAQIRDAVLAVYRSMPSSPQGVTLRTQLIAAMAHMYDSAPMDLFLTEASNRGNHIDVRQMAAQMYAFLADAAEADRLKALIASEPPSAQGGHKEELSDYKPLLDMASRCNRDVSCWKKNLASTDPIAVRKSAYMLGRFGSGPSVVEGLVTVLDNPDLSARLAVLMAIDHVAVKGSPEAVQKIEDMQEREEGRSNWVRFRDHALPVHARLLARQQRS